MQVAINPDSKYLASNSELDKLYSRVRSRVVNFERLLQIREYIDSLPEYTLTYAIANAMDNSVHLLDNDDLMPLNTWKVPEVYPIRQKPFKFVNPHHKDASKYANVYVEFNMHRIVRSGNMPNLPDQYKLEAERTRLQLRQRRYEFILKALHHHYREEEMSLRMNVGANQPMKLARKWGIDWLHERSKGRHFIVEEWEAIRDAGYYQKDIGKVYGESQSVVSTYLRDNSLGVENFIYPRR